MKRYQAGGLSAAIAGAAILLSLGAIPAAAQAPGGSYVGSCNNIQAFGDRIVADCRRMDGGWNRTALHDVDSCIGDIGNMNGQLTCNRGGQGSSDQPAPGYGYRGGYNGR